MPNHAENGADHRILETLNRLNRGVITNGSPDGMLRKILSAGTTLLPVAICSLWRSDDSQTSDALRLEAVQGANGRVAFPRTLQLPGSISRRVMTAGRFQMVPDLAAETAAAEKTMAAQRGLKSLLCVPVVSDGHDPAGVLHCFTRVRYIFSTMDIQVAEALARQTGIVWHMAALRGETQRLREELKTRKQVDRAKEILMGRRDMTAEDAYRWIQKRSMDSRRSMRAVAETIILSETTGHYTSIPHALDLLNKPPRK